MMVDGIIILQELTNSSQSHEVDLTRHVRLCVFTKNETNYQNYPKFIFLNKLKVWTSNKFNRDCVLIMRSIHTEFELDSTRCGGFIYVYKV